MVAQSFLPTEFDWRVGILDGEVLFVCRYYMARRHWQIVHRKKEGVEALIDENQRAAEDKLGIQVKEVRARLAAEPHPLTIDQDIKNLTGNVSALPSLFTWASGEVLVDNPNELKEQTQTIRPRA